MPKNYVVDKKKARPKRQRKSLIKYFKEVWNELKKVSWPTRKDTIAYTVSVLVFIVIFAVIIGLFDLGLTNALKPLLLL